MQDLGSFLGEEDLATVQLARELLGVEEVEDWILRGEDPTEPADEQAETMRERVGYLSEQLPFVNQTCEDFASVPENLKWMEQVARNVGAWNATDAEDLVGQCLYKFVVTNHVEKFNPLKASWKHHIYRAMRTTWITALGRRSRSVLTNAVPILNRSADEDSGEKGLSVGNISNVQTADGGIVLNSGSRPKVLTHDDPAYAVVLKEEVALFVDWLDEVETGIKASARHTKMSEIWNGYWVENKTLDGGKVSDGEATAYLEGLCDLAVVQPSTMRRYFDRLRYRFILRFKIDLPHRLWHKPEDVRLYGRKPYTQKATFAFLDRWRNELWNRAHKLQQASKTRSNQGSAQSAATELFQWDRVSEKMLTTYKRSLLSEVEQLRVATPPDNYNETQSEKWFKQRDKKAAGLNEEARIVEQSLKKLTQEQPAAAQSKSRSAHLRSLWAISV